MTGFDPAFPRPTGDHGPAQRHARRARLADRCDATFYRVTGQRTVTIVPDTPAKAPGIREGNRPDVLRPERGHERDGSDVLRVVIDIRQIRPSRRAIAVDQDTPGRIAAAAKLIPPSIRLARNW